MAALYFKVLFLKCNYTFKYWVILINMYFTIWLGVGLGLLACNYASFIVIVIVSACKNDTFK